MNKPYLLSLFLGYLLLSCPGFVLAQSYNQDQADSVQQMYIAYYGRPGDPGGLNFWASRLAEGSGELATIVDKFGSSAEYTERFGNYSTSELINNIYQQIFGRNADNNGLTFYGELLDEGSSTPGSIARQIVAGINDDTTDATIFANKLSVANAYTSAVESNNTGYTDDDIDDAKALLDAVGSSDESLQAGLAAVEAYFNSCQTPLLCAWVLNDIGMRSTTISENNSNLGVLVNVQSVTSVSNNNNDYVLVTASGIPDYTVTATEELVLWLNSRPKAATDFATGASNAVAGSVLLFGSDIGYNSNTNSDGNCTTTGGAGYWPPGPVCPIDVEQQGYFPAQPSPASETCETGLGTMGYMVNGTSIFQWGDGQSETADGHWQTLAPVAEAYDVDICGGHAANGNYHHHFYSSCLADMVGDSGDTHSPVYGFAADGYALYGPWHADGVLVKSSWAVRDYSSNSATGCSSAGVRDCVFIDNTDPSQGMENVNTGTSTSGNYTSMSGNVFAATAGFFYEDYYWDSALSEVGEPYLDKYNGHDHGDYGYHYHLTLEADASTPAFPYTVGLQFYGEIQDNAITSCGGLTNGGPPGGGPPP